MSGTERKLIALFGGMIAGAAIGVLLSAGGRQPWIKRINRVITSGDNVKRQLTYRVGSVFERAGHDAADPDYHNDFIA